jgi:inosine-uridine nucleoside N-ribohydrolase
MRRIQEEHRRVGIAAVRGREDATLRPAPHPSGQTTVDWYGLGGEPPNVEVVLEVDGDRFWELMKGAAA